MPVQMIELEEVGFVEVCDKALEDSVGGPPGIYTQAYTCHPKGDMD